MGKAAKAAEKSGGMSLVERAERTAKGEKVPLSEPEAPKKPTRAKKPENGGGRITNGGAPRGGLPTKKAHLEQLKEAQRMLKEEPMETEAEWRLYFDTVARPKGWARRSYEKIRDTKKKYSALIEEQEKADK